MEKFNSTNNKDNIQDIVLTMKKIFLHIFKPEYIPVGSEYVSVAEIDKIPDNCSEIILADLLDYVDYGQTSSILDIIEKKLAKDGTISLQSVDLKQLASAILFEDIDIVTTKQILYANKKNIHIMKEIEHELKNRSMDIVEKKYINVIEYYIRAIKK